MIKATIAHLYIDWPQCPYFFFHTYCLLQWLLTYCKLFSSLTLGLLFAHTSLSSPWMTELTEFNILNCIWSPMAKVAMGYIRLQRVMRWKHEYSLYKVKGLKILECRNGWIMSEKHPVRRGLYILGEDSRLVMQPVISYQAVIPLPACPCFWHTSGGSRKDLLLWKAAWFGTSFLSLRDDKKGKGGLCRGWPLDWGEEQLTLAASTALPWQVSDDPKCKVQEYAGGRVAPELTGWEVAGWEVFPWKFTHCITSKPL